MFNYLTGYSSRRSYEQLLVAPVALRSQMKALIDRECEHHRAGRPARLIFKLNAIADPGIDPQSVPGQSVRDSRRSHRPRRVLPQARHPGHLRHDRGALDRRTVPRALANLLFENGGDPEVYIGSADLMERNLDRRVEVLCPVHQPDLRAHLRDVVLETLLADTDRARVLRTDGSYVPVSDPGAEPVNAQKRLLDVYSMLSSISL